jgi:hypothetical protein
MKMILGVLSLSLSLSLAACAGTPPPADLTVVAGQTSFTGWVRVSEGEFQLYPREFQVGEAFSRPCVSGALPRNAQRAGRDLTGSLVTFTGRTAPWSGATSQILEYEGSRIVNQCRRDLVILADAVTVLR